jgi:hypothetical protein
MLDIIDKIAEHKLHPFMAPIPDPRATTLFTLQDNIPYWLEVEDSRSGWWWLKPEGKTRARYTHEAQPYEYLEYLDQLELRFHVIVLYEIGENYLVIPFNPSDATQRGWANSQPHLMYLCRGIRLNPYTVVTARDLSGVLIYDNISLIPQLSTTPRSPQFNLAVELVNENLRRVNELIKKERIAQELAVYSDLPPGEARVRFDLAVSGASLDNLTELDSGFEVTWTYDGATFTMPVTQEGRIMSAGICLNNTDQEHSLSSIVSVMQISRQMKRFDLDRELHV